jgi:DNA-binding MarR family transcriptional regulator
MKTGDDEPAQETLDGFCLAARQAARAVTDLYDLVLSPAGLKITQFILLRAIAGQATLSQQQRGNELAVAPETISRRLAALKTAGWIELKSPQSGREHAYVLTASGKARMQGALAHWNRGQRRLRLCLGSRDWESAIALLRKLVAAAKRAEAARIPNRTARMETLSRAASGESGPARSDIKAEPLVCALGAWRTEQSKQ